MLGPGRLFSAKSLRGAGIANKNSGVSADKSGGAAAGVMAADCHLLALDLMVGGATNITDHPVSRSTTSCPGTAPRSSPQLKKHAASQRCDAIICQINAWLKAALTLRLP